MDNGNENDNVKFVVFNSAEFIIEDNYLAYYANADFFLNTISWLKSGEDDIYIRGKMLSSQALYISSANTLYLIMGSIVILILLLFAASIVVYLKRKNL